jgi:hypothetical protein
MKSANSSSLKPQRRPVRLPALLNRSLRYILILFGALAGKLFTGTSYTAFVWREILNLQLEILGEIVLCGLFPPNE